MSSKEIIEAYKPLCDAERDGLIIAIKKYIKNEYEINLIKVGLNEDKSDAIFYLKESSDSIWEGVYHLTYDFGLDEDEGSIEFDFTIESFRTDFPIYQNILEVIYNNLTDEDLKEGYDKC